MSKNPDEYDSAYFKRWINDDALFLRHVKCKSRNLDEAVPYLLDVLRWRKKFNVSELTETSFPKEFYESGGMYINGFDRQGNLLCFVRTRFYYKEPVLYELFQKFSIYNRFKIDEMAASLGKQYVLVHDLTGTTLANFNKDAMLFTKAVLTYYMPLGFEEENSTQSIKNRDFFAISCHTIGLPAFSNCFSSSSRSDSLGTCICSRVATILKVTTFFSSSSFPSMRAIGIPFSSQYCT